MNVLVFLFGVWFNPTQVIMLQDIRDQMFRGDSRCKIVLSRGRGQAGPEAIYSRYACHRTARMINRAAAEPQEFRGH